MIGISVDKAAIEELKQVLNGNASQLKKQLKIAVNATAKVTKREINDLIRSEIVVKKKDVDRAISVKPATSEANPSSVVTLRKEKRLSLKDFGARQNTRGVTYKISKKGKRGFVAGGFQGPRPGVMKVSWRGNAFKRAGKSRLPIVKLLGPSPWGVVVINKGYEKAVRADTRNELTKQIKKRIRFLRLKASGGLRGKQS